MDFKWIRPAIRPVPPSQIEVLSLSAVRVLKALEMRFQPAPVFSQPRRPRPVFHDQPLPFLGITSNSQATVLPRGPRGMAQGWQESSNSNPFIPPVNPEESFVPRYPINDSRRPEEASSSREQNCSSSVNLLQNLVQAPPSHNDRQFHFAQQPIQNSSSHEDNDSSWLEVSGIYNETDIPAPRSVYSSGALTSMFPKLDSNSSSPLSVFDALEDEHVSGPIAKSLAIDAQDCHCTERENQKADEIHHSPEFSPPKNQEIVSNDDNVSLYDSIDTSICLSFDDTSKTFAVNVGDQAKRSGVIKSPERSYRNEENLQDPDLYFHRRKETQLFKEMKEPSSSRPPECVSSLSLQLSRSFSPTEDEDEDDLTQPFNMLPSPRAGNKESHTAFIQTSFNAKVESEGIQAFSSNNVSSRISALSPNVTKNSLFEQTRSTSESKKKKFLGTPFKRALSASCISNKEFSDELDIENKPPESHRENKENHEPSINAKDANSMECSLSAEILNNSFAADDQNQNISLPRAETSAPKTPTGSKSYFSIFTPQTKRKVNDCAEQSSRIPPESCKKKLKFTVPYKRQFQQDVESPSSHKRIQELAIKLGKEMNKKVKIQYLSEQLSADIIEKWAQSPPQETSLTLQYKGGLCQLNRPKTCDTHAPECVLLRIAWSPDVQYLSVPLERNAWSCAFLKKLLSDKARKICFQAQEMIQLLVDKFGFHINEVCSQWLILDPLVGCWLLNPDEPPHSFKEVLAFLKLPEDCNGTEMMLCKLSHCAEILYANLSKHGLWKVFLHIEMRITPILSCMEMHGIQVDRKKLQEMATLLKGRLESVQRASYQAAGKQFQLTSPQQLSAILYDQLKLDCKHNISVKETDKRHKSTSESMLIKFKDLHPLPGLVLEFRGLHKLKSTYVDALLGHLSGNCIYTTWDQISAATGRITSNEPNLQNIPKQPLMPDLLLRTAFVAREGCSFLSADFQHIELRVFAHLSKDTALIRVLSEDTDVFKVLSKQWLQIQNIDEVSEEDRDKTKRIVYALMYGAGPSKLVEFLHISHTEACSILKQFTGAFPKMQEFSKSTVDKCRKQGYLATETGRRRWFPHINSPNFQVRMQSERQAVNFLIQGTAADLCKCAMVHTQRLITSMGTHKPSPTASLLLQIHDELLWEVSDPDLPDVTNVVQEAMEGATTVIQSLSSFSVPLPVIIKIGKTWGNMEIVKSASLGPSQQF